MTNNQNIILTYKKRNMNGLNGNNYVYKYMPLKYLLSLLQSKKMRVDRVSKWEDPYENFFLKEDFYLYADLYKRDIAVTTREVIERTYGQCWTLKEESDAMWRIYSHIKDDIKDSAVKIKVTIDNLFDVVYTENNCMATTSIGQVQYETTDKFEEIRSKMSEEASMTSNLQKIIKECLYTKRDPFSHEEEVRIIILNSSETPIVDHLEFDIQDLSIFKEFVLDPRLNDDKVNLIIEELKQCGVPNERIRKSDLYEFIPKRTKL